MKRRNLSLVVTLVTGCALGAAMLMGPTGVPAARADNAYHNLATTFAQNWPSTALISVNDDWSGVPSILGYSGAQAHSTAAIDPQTVLSDLTIGASPVVSANVTSLSITSAASAAVFELHPSTDGVTQPTVALHASSNFDAPFLLIHLNSTGRQNIVVQYDVEDIDAGNYNAIQPVALQYRVGTTGNFTNVPAGYIADATEGPGLKGKVTQVNATLPAAANNKAQLQIRILTTNANGTDEFISIDNISITSTAMAVATATNTQPGPTATNTTVPPTSTSPAPTATNTQPGPTATATTPPPTPDPALNNKLYIPVVVN